MPVFVCNGCISITHSKYYSQWIGGLPYKPQIYWNVITDNDVIPVTTYGYKNIESSIKQIKLYISNIIECKLLHVETETEHEIYKRKSLQRFRDSFK